MYRSTLYIRVSRSSIKVTSTKIGQICQTHYGSQCCRVSNWSSHINIRKSMYDSLELCLRLRTYELKAIF
jgi:hypothetical protein